jgi:hypothetical protein
MLMDDESIGVNKDSGLCDQISNVLEMMVRSCPFKNACVDEFVALLMVHVRDGPGWRGREVIEKPFC